MHNTIPEPDRAKDNSTMWQANYDTAHYENMYFNRMALVLRARVERDVHASTAPSPSG